MTNKKELSKLKEKGKQYQATLDKVNRFISAHMDDPSSSTLMQEFQSRKNACNV